MNNVQCLWNDCSVTKQWFSCCLALLWFFPKALGMVQHWETREFWVLHDFLKHETLNWKDIVTAPRLPGTWLGWGSDENGLSSSFVVRFYGYLAGCRARGTKNVPRKLENSVDDLTPARSIDTLNCDIIFPNDHSVLAQSHISKNGNLRNGSCKMLRESREMTIRTFTYFLQHRGSCMPGKCSYHWDAPQLSVRERTQKSKRFEPYLNATKSLTVVLY